MVRGALRRARIDSPEAFRCATPTQLADMGDHALLLRRLIDDGRPDVLAVLFDPLDWYVALLLTDSRDRLLCIASGERLMYRADHPGGDAAVTIAVVADTLILVSGLP